MTKRTVNPTGFKAKVDIGQVFDGIAQTMLADFDLIQSQIDHAGERGEDREWAVRDFLSKYLPKKYAVGSGQIIDRFGGISRQCDVVIYDAFNCPLLMAKEGYQVFPIEAVLAVIEVKSVLTASTIRESVTNIHAAKSLVRDEPIAGFVFAYRSSYQQEPRVERAARALREANKEISPRHRIDVVCILAEGLIMEPKAKPDWGEKRCSMHVLLPEVSPLVLFLYSLIEALEDRKSSLPSIAGYASDGYLGIAKYLGSD